jgi:hypothetical protein
MNLGQIRAEVLNHGFDAVLFPQGRIDSYINDGYMRVVSGLSFYSDEASMAVQTTAGASALAFPPDFGNARSLVDTDRQRVLEQCALSDIDGAPLSSGHPVLYSVDGNGFRLYPTPDAPYNLLLRYWSLPPRLVLDSDVPVIPDVWHRILWYWGCKEAYASEDDTAGAQYWEQQFNATYSEFKADVKFPTEYPEQVRSMWEV